MSPDERRPPFLDTTYLLPFFQIHVTIEGFTLTGYHAFLTQQPHVHFSELSIYEAKATIHRLSRRDTAFVTALTAFGDNLATLRDDAKIVLHPYRPQDDQYYNMIAFKKLGLDSFDTIILAQALSTGLLITENRELLRVRDTDAFHSDPALGRLTIRQWKEMTPSKNVVR